MRIVHDVSGETSLAWFDNWTADGTDWRAQDEAPATVPSTQFPAEPAAPRPFVSALRWLANCVLQGFVAYANTMYPCLVDPGVPVAPNPPASRKGARELRSCRGEAMRD